MALSRWLTGILLYTPLMHCRQHIQATLTSSHCISRAAGQQQLLPAGQLSPLHPSWFGFAMGCACAPAYLSDVKNGSVPCNSLCKS
jgi:hypothetical protein